MDKELRLRGSREADARDVRHDLWRWLWRAHDHHAAAVAARRHGAPVGSGHDIRPRASRADADRGAGDVTAARDAYGGAHDQRGRRLGRIGGHSDCVGVATDVLLPRVTYAFEPGTHAEFSPVEEAVLALALSRAAHQPYAAYVKQRILQPLGMTHSDFAGAAADPAGLGYWPALYTTIGDLARLARLALLSGPDAVVTKQDLEENYRRTWVVNSIAVPNPSEGFGVGFEGETWTSNRLPHYYFILPIGSGGAGYDAALWFEPRTHAGVVLLHHGGGSALGQLIHTYVYTLNAQPIDAGRQESARPLPYAEETVTFPSANGAVTIAGTLTMPEGRGPFPAAVLISKGGGFDRDEQMLSHRPFQVLADALAP